MWYLIHTFYVEDFDDPKNVLSSERLFPIYSEPRHTTSRSSSNNIVLILWHIHVVYVCMHGWLCERTRGGRQSVVNLRTDCTPPPRTDILKVLASLHEVLFSSHCMIAWWLGVCIYDYYIYVCAVRQGSTISHTYYLTTWDRKGLWRTATIFLFLDGMNADWWLIRSIYSWLHIGSGSTNVRSLWSPPCIHL